MSQNSINRRDFVIATGSAAAGILIAGVVPATARPLARKRYAIVGTGHRATGMWGKDLAERYSNEIEFVGLCDKNPLRVEAGKKLIGVECPISDDAIAENSRLRDVCRDTN